MDGVVRSGQTSINQAPVTGEHSVDKASGDRSLPARSTSRGHSSSRSPHWLELDLARIIHAVGGGSGDRAPTQGFVDRFAAIYTPAVFVIAVAVALLGPWLLGWTWLQARLQGPLCCWSSLAPARW